MDIYDSRLIEDCTPPNLTVEDKDSDLNDLLDFDKETYPRTYSFLKAQSQTLKTLSATIESNLKSSNEMDTQNYQKLDSFIFSVLKSDFGSVFLVSSNTIPHIQELLADSKVPRGMKVIASIFLKVCINLSRIFSYVSCNLPTEVATKTEPEEQAPADENSSQPSSDNQMYTLCRICEEYVPIDMIEQHSKVCMLAYESEFAMITTNEKIKKLRNGIRNSVLNSEWPGDSDTTIGTILPMLHVTMLLDVLTQADNLRAAEVFKALNKIEIVDPSPEVQSFLDRSKELTTEKVKASSTFTKAAAALQKTRVSGHAYGAQSLQTSIADFEFVKRISSGAFAKVYLAVKIRTGDRYAIKVTPKSQLKQKNTLKRALIEKDILLQNNNPYIVDLYYSIIGNHNLYLVMEFLPGGDLYSLLQETGSLDEECTKTYTAQIVKALEYLHKRGIIHRDLKPDNILININGKLKLTDFGLSLYGSFDRGITDDNKSIVGTPDYLAPEIILSQPHTFTVDYWSLGCVIYEFLVGTPPFHRNTEAATFAQILACRYDLSLLDDFSSEVKNLITRLLTVDPTKRIGANGIEEIMSHPWFNDIDWDNVDDLEPVFVPDPKGKDDVEYFQERYTFQKNDHIEKDILEDIEYAKIQSPHSVSMTDISSKSSFASKASGEEDFDDSEDEMSSFPAIALQNLSKRSSSGITRHKRSMSISPGVESFSQNAPMPISLGQSKSFMSTSAASFPKI